MWFKWKSKRVRELEAHIFDLESALTQSQQFERIAAEKLAVWVQKHDDLLLRFKALQHESITSTKS